MDRDDRDPKIQYFHFLKVVCSVCFLQKETKKSPKTQKSRFLCPKRFLAFSVQCLFCKIKKLKNADYGQQRAQKSEKSMIFMSEQAIVIRKYSFVKKLKMIL